MADVREDQLHMSRIACSFVAGMVVFLSVGSAVSQSAITPEKVDVQQPTAGIDAVMAYAGTWKVQGERFTTPYSTAGKEETTLRNECWKSGVYVACNQYVNGESKALIVYTYSDLSKTYTTYPIPPDGQAASAGRLQIVGNVWTFPWEVTRGGVTTYFHVVNVFKGTDHIDYAQEFSPDNVHWTTMAKGSDTKVGN
jgi:hypothetical protein